MPMESCSSVLVNIPATVTGMVLSLSSTFTSSMVSPTDRPLRWAKFLVDQHLAAGLGGDGVALHHLKAAIGEITVLLGVGVGHHPSGVLVALRHLGGALGV